jgi:carboxylesterase type B
MGSFYREPCLQRLESRGYIQGVTIRDRISRRAICNYFGGIPYAEPPINEHRWRKPRELPPCYSYGTRTHPGRFDGRATKCPQDDGKGAEMDENCLQLNVWIPSGEPPKSGWPVYFYIRMI